MPDAIATIGGKAAMAFNSRNGLPWHKLGTPLDDVVEAEEMQKAAGLDWQVVKQPLLTYGVGDKSLALLDVPGRMATIRDIDSHVIGTVGETYQPIQNSELFEFANALASTGEPVKFETAGALYDGRVVWALASIPDKAIRIDGDNGEIMPYLVLSTGHDGLRAFQATFTPVRVVCANTLNMALKGARETFTIRHTVKALDKVEDARRALRLNVEYIETLRAAMTLLNKRRCPSRTSRTSRSPSCRPSRATRRRPSRSSGSATRSSGLYQNSVNLADVPETRYRLLQAVAEWADHDRVYRATKKGSADDARALAILDGTAVEYKDRALALLLPEAAKRGPGGKFVKASAN
jgi:phage/plasmid-like protein (TIGR03299 family)